MLEIKNNNTGKDEIGLVREANSVSVEINGEVMDRFRDHGGFDFYGTGDNTQFRGEWK